MKNAFVLFLLLLMSVLFAVIDGERWTALIVTSVLAVLGWFVAVMIDYRGKDTERVVKKPQKKIENELVITYVSKTDREITFSTSYETFRKVREFGDVFHWSTVSNKYTLTVGYQYDFEEVLRYMKDLGTRS